MKRLPTSKNRTAGSLRLKLVESTVSILVVSCVRMVEYSSPKGLSSVTAARRGSSSARRSVSTALRLMKEYVTISRRPAAVSTRLT